MGKELEVAKSPVSQPSVLTKAASKRPLTKSAEQIRIEEAIDKRIKQEKIFYGRREAK